MSPPSSSVRGPANARDQCCAGSDRGRGVLPAPLGSQRIRVQQRRGGLCRSGRLDRGPPGAEGVLPDLPCAPTPLPNDLVRGVPPRRLRPVRPGRLRGVWRCDRLPRLQGRKSPLRNQRRTHRRAVHGADALPRRRHAAGAAGRTDGLLRDAVALPRRDVRDDVSARLAYAAGGAMGCTVLAKETSILLVGSLYAFFALAAKIRVRIRDLVFSLGCMGAVMIFFPISMKFGGKPETGGQYLAWQLFRRPNHDWPSTASRSRARSAGRRRSGPRADRLLGRAQLAREAAAHLDRRPGRVLRALAGEGLPVPAADRAGDCVARGGVLRALVRALRRADPEVRARLDRRGRLAQALFVSSWHPDQPPTDESSPARAACPEAARPATGSPSTCRRAPRC